MTDQEFNFDDSQSRLSGGNQSLNSYNNRAAVNQGRLPMINNTGASIQQLNQNRNFEFGEARAEDQNDQHFDEFGNRLAQEGADPFAEDDNQLLYEQQEQTAMRPTPSKTGGQVKIEQLNPAHVAQEKYIGRDALNVIEGEMRQFDGKFDQAVKRFVEQIVTGEFLNVKKDVDLAPQVKGPGALDKLDLERELLKNQILWIGRINALFAGSLGTLSGMSMLHIIIIFSIQDLAKFIDFYAKFARNVNIIFMMLASLALILGLVMSLVYRQKSIEKMRTLDNERHSHRSQYTIAFVLSLALLFCWVVLFSLPYYTIQIHYKDPADITDSQVNTMRALYGLANSLLIVTFIAQQFATQQGPSDEELEPESDDDGIDTESEDEEETAAEDGAANLY